MRRPSVLWGVVLAWMVMSLMGCVAAIQAGGPETQTPRLTQTGFVTSDGVELPMQKWEETDQKPWAILLAVHGMNDYSHGFEDFAQAAAVLGVRVYAYDQRGFGRAPNPGIWAGWPTMERDLHELSQLLRTEHPNTPLYVLGESMGGGVVMNADADGLLTMVDGIILSAPAVWDRKSMILPQRFLLWVARKIAPGWVLTGRGLNIYPSDNLPMLKRMSEDPLIIKGTRVDAIDGLVDLMDRAQSVAPKVTHKALILYGENDQVVPREPMFKALVRLPGLGTDQKVALYPKGWHTLLRDIQAPTVWNDVIGWLRNPSDALSSGADKNADMALKDWAQKHAAQ